MPLEGCRSCRGRIRSDPGYTNGPIPVDISGATLLTAGVVYAPELVFTAAESFSGHVALDWAATGALQGGSCSICTLFVDSFEISLTGIEVDG